MLSGICKTIIVNKKRVQREKRKLINHQTAENLATIFKALSDPTRIKIFNALFNKELCVCDLAAIIGLSQSATSHQLRFLRNMNLVKYRKEGKMVFYSLADHHVETLFNVALKHMKHGNLPKSYNEKY